MAAEFAQSIEHDAGVVRVQQVLQFGRALRQRSEQQHAVGNAFGAGQGDRAAGAVKRWYVKKVGREHKGQKLRTEKCIVEVSALYWSILMLGWPGLQRPARAHLAGLVNQLAQSNWKDQG